MKIKKFVDLSWDITEQTPIYPGDPEPKISVATTLESDGYNLSSVDVYKRQVPISVQEAWAA